MKYISTRDSSQKPVSAAEAIVRGIANDGGLYVPQSFPAYLPPDLAKKSYQELAKEIFGLYLGDFGPEEIAALVDAAYGDNFPQKVAPCLSVGPFELLELFHGPTAAFKDLALQALPHLLTAALRKCGTGQEAVILVATSGDTGKAALEGFKDVPGCRVIVFYPAGGVSEIQERQMLCAGGSNTGVLAVYGNFDDCQNGVKRIFADQDLISRMGKANLGFSSANSINFGRLLPQIVYYYDAYKQLLAKGRLKAGQSFDVAVPTGNFGNILAAYYGLRMGLPIRRLICASNENDVLAEAISSGHYNRLRPFYKTDSPSMDILVSSNFERFLFEMYGRKAEACAAALGRFSAEGQLQIEDEARAGWENLLFGGAADNEEAARYIDRVFAEHNYLLDPHTAVGWAVAEGYRQEGDQTPLLLTATASPYKFSAAVLKALGQNTAQLGWAEQLALLEQHSGVKIPASLAALAALTPGPRREISAAAMAEALAAELGLKKFNDLK